MMQVPAAHMSFSSQGPTHMPSGRVVSHTPSQFEVSSQGEPSGSF